MKIIILIFSLLFIACDGNRQQSDAKIRRTVVLEDSLGVLKIDVPLICDSFSHIKGKITHDRISGDSWEYSRYIFKGRLKDSLSIIVSHKPFNENRKDWEWKISDCEFNLQNNNRVTAMYRLVPFDLNIIEQNCYEINSRIFAVKAAFYKPHSNKTTIYLTGFTAYKKRHLEISMEQTVTDTSNIIGKMFGILKTVTLEEDF